MTRDRLSPSVLPLLAGALGIAGCASLQESPRTQAGADATATPRPTTAGDEPATAQLEGPLVPELLRWEPPPEHAWARIRRGFDLPEVAEARYAGELERYSGLSAHFERVTSRAEPYIDYIVARLEARGLPTELALVPIVESAFRPFAYSYSRAGGLWQFKPATARHFGLEMNWWYDGRRDVLASTEAALDYFEYLHGFFDGDWLLAIAAYNAGEGTVQRAMLENRRRGEPTDFWHLDLPQQTEAYVPRVLALRQILEHPERHGISLSPPRPDRALEVVEIEGQVDLARAAEWTGLDVETLYRYNPGLNRWATAPEGPHRLVVPASHADRLRTALANHDPSEMVRWVRHRVEQGQTLNGIASRYDTTVEAIRGANQLRGSLIRAGDHLVVPTASRDADAYALSAPNRRAATQASGPGGRERVEVRVQPGDTLWAVAQDHGVDVRRLAAWNDMAPADPLHPGDQLVVWVDERHAGRGGPAERLQRVTYTVRRGDSLYAIAQRFNVEVSAIRRWNDLARGALLQPGQELLLRVDVTAQAERSG